MIGRDSEVAPHRQLQPTSNGGSMNCGGDGKVARTELSHHRPALFTKVNDLIVAEVSRVLDPFQVGSGNKDLGLGGNENRAQQIFTRKQRLNCSVEFFKKLIIRSVTSRSGDR